MTGNPHIRIKIADYAKLDYHQIPKICFLQCSSHNGRVQRVLVFKLFQPGLTNSLLLFCPAFSIHCIKTNSERPLLWRTLGAYQVLLGKRMRQERKSFVNQQKYWNLLWGQQICDWVEHKAYQIVDLKTSCLFKPDTWSFFLFSKLIFDVQFPLSSFHLECSISPLCSFSHLPSSYYMRIEDMSKNRCFYSYLLFTISQGSSKKQCSKADTDEHH